MVSATEERNRTGTSGEEMREKGGTVQSHEGVTMEREKKWRENKIWLERQQVIT